MTYQVTESDKGASATFNLFG